MVVIRKIGNFGTVSINLDKLNRIEMELNKYYAAHVGILGSKSRGRIKTVTATSGKNKGKHVKDKNKTPSDKTNAEIGLLHEKGSKSGNIPRRSFLEMPISDKFPQKLKEVANQLLENLTTENLRKTYQQVAFIGEDIVLKAFNTKGYGKWKENSPSTLARKHSSMPLEDTLQLRKSITSRVVERK